MVNDSNIGGWDSRVRKLSARGRISATIWEQTVALSEDGQSYDSVATSTQPQTVRERQRLRVLSGAGVAGMTASEFAAAADVSPDTARRALKRVCRKGVGDRGPVGMALALASDRRRTRRPCRSAGWRAVGAGARGMLREASYHMPTTALIGNAVVAVAPYLPTRGPKGPDRVVAELRPLGHLGDKCRDFSTASIAPPLMAIRSTPAQTFRIRLAFGRGFCS